MIVIGASGHSKVIIEALFSNGLKPDFIIDDNPKVEDIFGIEVKKCTEFPASKKVVIAVGDNRSRKEISDSHLFDYQKVFHRQSLISKTAKIGDGTVVLAQAVVNPDAVIGRHCIINTASVIEHDCMLADFVHVSPKAALAGGVVVGEGVHIGISACVIQGVKIGRWAVIGAGAVIVEDVPDYATVVGNPGRVIKINKPSNE